MHVEGRTCLRADYFTYVIIIGILPKGRSFTENSGTKAAILPKGRSCIANSETYVAVLLGMDRCGSLPLLSAPHSLFSILTDLKRSEKIPRGTNEEVRRVDLAKLGPPDFTEIHHRG